MPMRASMGAWRNTNRISKTNVSAVSTARPWKTALFAGIDFARTTGHRNSGALCVQASGRLRARALRELGFDLLEGGFQVFVGRFQMVCHHELELRLAQVAGLDELIGAPRKRPRGRCARGVFDFDGFGGRPLRRARADGMTHPGGPCSRPRRQLAVVLATETQVRQDEVRFGASLEDRRERRALGGGSTLMPVGVKYVAESVEGLAYFVGGRIGIDAEKLVVVELVQHAEPGKNVLR